MPKDILIETYIVRVRADSFQQAQAIRNFIATHFSHGGYGELTPEIRVERLVEEDGLCHFREDTLLTDTAT